MSVAGCRRGIDLSLGLGGRLRRRGCKQIGRESAACREAALWAEVEQSADEGSPSSDLFRTLLDRGHGASFFNKRKNGRLVHVPAGEVRGAGHSAERALVGRAAYSEDLKHLVRVEVAV
jgi:hypothetical protein